MSKWLPAFSFKTKIKFLVLLAALLWFWWALPAKLFKQPTSFVLEDANGQLLSASIAADGQWRFPHNAQVPEKFVACITAFEDQRFFYHPGVDPLAMMRAVRQNIGNARRVSGGSTITMQVVRLYRRKQRTVFQKAIECLLAFRLECSYSKKEIMALYTSNAPFGTNVVGLDAAAWRYYGRSAQQLSWGEMAALAVLPNAPTLVRPGKNQEQLLRKRNLILDRLVLLGTIDATTGNLAKVEPLPAAPLPLPQFAPHLLDRFKKDFVLQKQASTKMVTTIQLDLQKQVNDLLLRHHGVLKGNGINNICSMVMEVETGNVLAYVGNVYQPQNKELESHVDILSRPRSPGSTLKPILYASMLNDGLILPNQLIADVPTQIGGYTPQNFNLDYDGAVPASQALSRSLNIPAVRMLQQYKYQRFYDVLQQVGLSTLKQPANHYGLSLVLGGCEVTAWDLAGIYASMARNYKNENKWQGEYYTSDWHSPLYEKNAYKQLEKQGKLQAAGLLDRVAIWQMLESMNEVARPGEEGLWQQFVTAQKIAWKTGTSFGFRDGWAVGLTPKHVVVVWCGNADGEGRPDLTGINTAAPVLFDIFRLLPANSWFAKPAKNVEWIDACKLSGHRPNADCKELVKVLGNSKSNQAVQCPYHKLLHLDATAQYQVTEICEQPSNMQHQSWFVLPPVMEYYYRQRHAGYLPTPAFKVGCNTIETKAMELIYPTENSKLFVPRELTGEKGKLIFKAHHSNGEAVIHWILDDELVATTSRFHEVGVSPGKGKHSISLTDDKGNAIVRSFEVLEKTNN